MTIKRMTESEKNSELEKIFGMSVDSGSTSSVGAATVEDFYTPDPKKEDGEEVEESTEEGGEETTPEQQTETEAKKPEKEDYTWAETVRAENAAYAVRNQEIEAARQSAEARARQAEQELQQTRWQQQQKPAEKVEETTTTEEFYATPAQLKQMEQRLAQQNFQTALRQEQQSFVESMKHLQETEKGFGEVFTQDKINQAWNEYAKNPGAYGGLGRPWRETFQQTFRALDHQRLVKENADMRKQLDATKAQETAKNTEEKKKANANLSKVSQGGSGYQEPQSQIKWGVRREYGDPSLRKQVLQIVASGE